MNAWILFAIYDKPVLWVFLEQQIHVEYWSDIYIYIYIYGVDIYAFAKMVYVTCNIFPATSEILKGSNFFELPQ
jgi:hypothetical protein